MYIYIYFSLIICIKQQVLFRVDICCVVGPQIHNAPGGASGQNILVIRTTPQPGV